VKGDAITGWFVSRRAALTSWCGAVLLLGAAGFAYAAIFDDDVARKQISVERQRIDELKNELKKQQDAVDARIAKLEEASKNQALLDLFTQLEALKLEMNRLRGQIEVLNNNVENTAKRQRDMYVDLDTRVRRFEQQGGPAPASAPAAPNAAPAAAAGATAVATVKPTTPAAAFSPPAAAATAAVLPSAAAATTVDPGAENRVYEAAQGLRRVGNYQGAIAAFQSFINQYPKGILAPRAQYWIGDSYFNLRDFKLAIANQQTLIRTYPDSPSVPDAMLNIASSEMEMGDLNAGRKTLEELVMKYPVSEAADKAKRRLATVNAPASAGAPAGIPPGAPAVTPAAPKR
jgi:tol-pal system protein YbgF